MEYIVTISVFVFGIITWIPFLNGVYGHDVAGAMYWVDRMKKGDLILYKDVCLLPIGHLMHIIFMQLFWKKENTKAYYWIMCIYNSFSAVALFWVMFNLFGLIPATIGSVCFSLYIVSPRLDGNWGMFEQLLALPLMLSILCMIISAQPNYYLLIVLSGMLFGYSILIKQFAALYLPGYILIMISTGHSFTHHMLFLTGALIANLIPLLYYWIRHNAFWEYLTSVWLLLLPSAINPKKYNKFYPRVLVQGETDTKNKKAVIIKNSRSLSPIIFLGFIGIILLFTNHFSLLSIGLVLCLLASIKMIFMRGTFFAHYWLNIIPWLSIFAGFGLNNVIINSIHQETLNGVTIAGIIAIILLIYDAICVDRKYYVFSKDPYQFLRKVWGEGLVSNYKNWTKIGEYIKNMTKPEDGILICGWAPHILMYSDRKHFTPSPCSHMEDYLDIYNRENPVPHDFLNLIYKFKPVKKRENVFHKGYPEVIIFTEGKVNVEGFERLTGIKYSQDESLKILYRADLEITELTSMYEKSNTETLPLEEDINLMKKDLIDSVNKKNWNTAIETTKRLLKKAPKNRELLSILGDCLIKSGNYKLLFGFYNRLIGGKSTSVRMKLELLNKLGVAYCCLNKLGDAETLFKKILEAKPDNPVVLNNLGFVYTNQNKVEEAIECFQKSLEIDPSNEDAIFNLNKIMGSKTNINLVSNLQGQ
jgi:tetratricopeptide (TPR) repeat protein